jgi:conjugal transfer/type IV secretion protein DotA/TraY
MIIKKGIFILFAFLFGFLALNSAPAEANGNYFSNTIEAEGSDCGVAGGDMVASVSFSICKEDLAYNVVYMAFSKVFNQFDVLKAFVFEDAGALDQEGYASNMGGAILAIILGITQVVFIVGAVVLGLATVKVIYGSMTSGEFLGKGVNKVWVILRSLLVIFMIFPLGTVSLAQLCILMVALFAIMGGNFFYGIFLSTVQKEAMIAETGPNEESQNEAISQSDALINAALCQNRTLKAIRTKNYIKYESKWLGLSFETQMSRIANCIAPEAYYSYPLTTFSANPIRQGNVDSITIGKKTTCEGVADTTFLSDYDPEYHGYAFSCGSLSFANPKISEEVSTGNGQNDSTELFMSTTRDAISTYVADQYQNYGLAGKLASYYGKASTIKSGNEFSYKTLDSDINSFAANLTTGGKALYTEVKTETDHNTAVKSLYVANSILLNNLLGGKSEASESVVGLLNVVNAPALIVTGVTELGKTLNDRYALKKEDSFAALEKYSVNSASALDQVHCLKNFNNVVSTVYGTKKAIEENKEDKFKAYLEKSGSFFAGECLWFVSEAEKINPRYAVEGFASPTFKAGSKTVKITMGPAGSLVAAQVDEATVAAKMNTDIVGMTLEAQVNKMALASHFYVVREAIKKSMIDVLAESTDKELPKKMRKQGFASFGGFILQISSDQTNLNKYIKKINSGVKWSAFSEGGEGQYVEMDAFGKVDLSAVKTDIKFTPMVVVDFFAGGSSTTQVASGATTGGNSGTADDSGFMNSIYRTIENGLTGPMVYLKKMGGTDLNLPLRAGVEKCFKEGNCYPGDVHPVNALSYMGIDLMDTAIKFFMLKVVINLINKVMNADLGSNGSTSKASWISKIANTLASGLLIGKIAKYSVMIAEGVVNFLAPIFALLFLAGVFFGYMLPILPYVAFLIMFLGWIVYIFELMITVPIWLIMMAIPGPNGQPRGNLTLLWQYTGLLLLKPSLMVIGLIFGWYFSVLSIFFINMTFFGVMGSVFESHTGFTVMGIIDIIMFYFVYLVIVFVALKHSFSIISSFPQTVAEAIELKGYSDKQTISSVGAEQLLGLAIVGKVKGALTEAVGGAGKKVDHLLGNSQEQRNERHARNEARKTATSRLNEHFPSSSPQNSSQANNAGNGGSGFGGAGGGANPSNSDTRTADSGKKDKKEGNDDPVV